MARASGFHQMFVQATQIAQGPYPYQIQFACGEALPQLIHIPTGLGKTAAVVLGWLWRRRFAEEAIQKKTPRRLVYCLPMRVLVEQTFENVVRWLQRLGLLAGEAQWDEPHGRRLRQYRVDMEAPVSGWAAQQGVSGHTIPVWMLMGGETVQDWDWYPERDAILIGTQDMLLSRALNRGYAMSRNRWPWQFGLLHNDCLWVFDEIQLMGSGLPTTAQLEAFRKQPHHNRNSLEEVGLPTTAQREAFRDVWPLSKNTYSIWMSATLEPNWLKTVDFDPTGLSQLTLQPQDFQHKEVVQRFHASKPLAKAVASMGDLKKLAEEILAVHRSGTRTLVVVNTVGRARELYSSLLQELLQTSRKKRPRQPREKASGEAIQAGASPKIILIHSRFRPPDRQKAIERLLEEVGPEGTIVVSTQVVEAGVDISATTLFTELAPWASLVQRFGRCNRKGDDPNAQVFWIDPPAQKKKAESASLPYSPEQLEEAREILLQCSDVSPANVQQFSLSPPKLEYVIRRKDLLELFDTTPDLAGNDIDIDRYVREVEKSDVHVFWRDWDPKANPEEEAPLPQELCPVSVEEFRGFLEAAKDGRRLAYRWDFLDKQWVRADSESVYPGQVYLLHVSEGGYSPETGWDGKSPGPVPLVQLVQPRVTFEGNEDDFDSQQDRWQSIAEHTDELCQTLEGILAALQIDVKDQEALRLAARWHDRGKAHAVFQGRILSERNGEPRPVHWDPPDFIAKAPGANKKTKDPGWWAPQYERKHFRHELASALAVLLEQSISKEIRHLVAYLAAAHHGKVRLSIRSLPGETPPQREAKGSEEVRFARGIWDGDVLPATALGGGILAPEVQLSLEPMELGLCQTPPFDGQPSWAERMLKLRDGLGPFRLAYLEALLRAADVRTSRAATLSQGD